MKRASRRPTTYSAPAKPPLTPFQREAEALLLALKSNATRGNVRDLARPRLWGPLG